MSKLTFVYTFLEGPFININRSMNYFQEFLLWIWICVTWLELPACLTLRTGGLDRRTKQSNLLFPSNTSKLLKQHSIWFKWIHFKTSSNSPDSLGQTSCTLKVQQLNEQISKCFLKKIIIIFLPNIYQMGRHLHAWGLKGKHIGGKYNPDLSSQIWVSHISDINKIFLFQDMCKGKPSRRGRNSVVGL